MKRLKHLIKALALCGLALGLVVLGTSGVQAEKGANWFVNGKSVTATLSPEVVMAEIVTEDMTLLTKILGKKVELLCQGAQFISAKLETEGKVGGENKVKFSSCQMILDGKLTAACEPHTKGQENGTLLSNALKGLLVLSGGEGVILFEPVSGTTFLTLEFAGGCAIGSTCSISGKNSVRESNGKLATEQVNHSVEQGPIAELWVVSNTPEHHATVDGVGVLSLGGVHKGLPWSGTPG